MTDLQRDLRKFYFRLNLRVASYAALWGLVLSLPVVIAMPWLREWLGVSRDAAYWFALALPVALPAFYAGVVLFIKPPEREQVLAADYWFGDSGSIVSAYEMERQRPGDPFVQPIARQARALMHDKPLPEPRWLRRALLALIILLLLTPLSRWAYAQMEEHKQEDEKQKQAKKPDVKPQDAEQIAKSAGEAAEKAKKIGSKQQEDLANDLEEVANRQRVKADDKETAMRNANAVTDRAKAQVDAQEDRQDARDALKDSPAEELRKAVESNDPKRVEDAARRAANSVYKENGEIDTATAKALQEAIEEARRAAPDDASVKKAAEALEEQLQRARDKGGRPNEQKQAETALREKMGAEGASSEDVEKAIDEMRKTSEERRQVEAQELKRALEEVAKAIDPKRDIDPSGKRAEEIRRKLEKGEISPEQAEEMVKAAREIAKQMEIDAETLKEMIKQGKDFEGMEEIAKRIAEQAKKDAQNGDPQVGPEDVPDWVRKAMEDPEWQEIAKKMAEKVAERKGEPGQPGDRKPGPDGKPVDGSNPDGKPGEGKAGPDGKPIDGGNSGEGKVGPDGKPVDGSGRDGGGGKGETTGPDGKPIDPKEVRKEGVDVKDTGKGEKDPDAERKELDAKKAAEEKAAREATGRKGTSDDVNTKEELDRLPRRYRDAARKYFERK
jgi:hypothetical protein